MNFVELKYMAPEIIISLAFLIMIAADVYLKNKKAVAYFGIFAIIASMFFIKQPDSKLFLYMYVNDAYSIFFKYMIFAAGAIGLFLAAAYRNPENENEGEFYYIITAMVLSMALLASTVDFILIYVLIELISLASYILVGFLKKDPRSSEGSIKYFLIGALSSGIMLYGMSLIYGVCASTNIIAIAMNAGKDTLSQPLFIAGTLFLLAGFSFKAALAPFHFWSPDAYEGAPTPITALLSVGPKCAAFAVFGRIIYTIFPAFSQNYPEIMTMLGVLTMTLGNTAAIWQKDIKRMMAYSSIAQAGYIFIGIAAGAEYGFKGMLFYLMAYVFMNLGVFAAVIAVSNRTGSSDISSFAGLAKKAPFLAASMLVLFLSLAGIPPTSGFVGKFFLFMGALQAKFYMLAIFGVLNSVISVYYYFGVVKTMYFSVSEDNAGDGYAYGDGAIYSLIVICLLMTLAAGFYPEPFINFTRYGMQFIKSV